MRFIFCMVVITLLAVANSNAAHAGYHTKGQEHSTADAAAEGGCQAFLAYEQQRRTSTLILETTYPYAGNPRSYHCWLYRVCDIPRSDNKCGVAGMDGGIGILTHTVVLDEYLINEEEEEQATGPQCASVSNPISPATGNKFQKEVDIVAPSPQLLSFTRAYNSQNSSLVNDIGWGWSHSFSPTVSVTPYRQPTGVATGVQLRSSQHSSNATACQDGWSALIGQGAAFQTASGCQSNTPPSNGTFWRATQYPSNSLVGTMGPGEFNLAGYLFAGDSSAGDYSLGVMSDVKISRPDGSYLRFVGYGSDWNNNSGTSDRLFPLLDASGVRIGWQLTTANDEIESFDENGKLTSIEYLDGRHLNILYDIDGNLESVTANTGEQLTFAVVNGVITGVTDVANRTWSYLYDNAGNLELVINPDSTTRQYHYEDTRFSSVLTGITDERGIRYASYGYDDQARAIMTHHANNADRVDIVYNADGTRTVSNSRGVVSTYDTGNHLASRNVTTITGPGCASCGSGNTSYEYDPISNNLLSKTENDLITQYGNYDTHGNVGYKIEAFGTPEERRIDYTYDPRFNSAITSISKASVAIGQQQVTTYGYDDFGNPTSVTISGYQPDGTAISRTTTYQYHGPLNQLSQIDDARSDVSDIITLDYHPYTAYDEQNPAPYNPNNGRLLRITGPNGVLSDNLQYTSTGKVASEARPNNLNLDYRYYPGNDRLQSLTLSDGTTSSTTHWGYLNTGEVNTLTQGYGTPEATTLTFGYDAARRLTRITDGLGNYFEYTLDTEGNKEAEKTYDPNGVLTQAITQTFDLYNQLDTLSQANEIYDYNFAPNGELESFTDGNNITADYGYDALSRLIRTTQNLGGINLETADAITVYDYDAHDNLTTVIDPNGNTTSYHYDDLSNLLSLTSPDTGTTSYSYDAAGNITRKQDANGTIVTYRYDALNRLTDIDAPGTIDDISYTYDLCTNGIGYLCSITTAHTTVSYQYDGLGNITQHQGVSYSYDAVNRINTVIYPSGAIVSYDYNAAGQVNQVRLTQNGLSQILASNITYAPFGPVSTLNYGNGLSLNQALDSAYRYTDITIPGLISLNTQQYDGNGNLTQRQYDATAESFNYDPLNRLDIANGTFGNRDYDYDKNSNRGQLITDGTTDTYGYSPNSNRLASINSAPIQRDNNGNTLTLGNRSLVYNAHNRLTDLYDNSILSARYTYNGLGQRTIKQLNSQRGDVSQDQRVDMVDYYLLYLYLLGEGGYPLTNGDCDLSGAIDLTDLNCLAGNIGSATAQGDVDQNGSVNQTDHILLSYYLQGQQQNPLPASADCDDNALLEIQDLLCIEQQMQDAVVTAIYGLNGELLGEYRQDGRALNEYLYLNGQPLAILNQGQVYTLHNDHLGTPQVMSNALGQNVWQAHYDPFGNATVNEDVDGDGQKISLNLRFPGQYYDQESGLHYNYFRYYDPSTGRYITSDPIGLDGGLNTYGYVGGNPLSYVDPYGLSRLPRANRNRNVRNEYFPPIGTPRQSSTSRKNQNSCDASYPPNLSPPGAGRRGAHREAKRQSGVPVSQQPSRVTPNIDRRGNPQPGRNYEYQIPTSGGGRTTVNIRNDSSGHSYGPNNPQNRGPHFNDRSGNHFDY